MGALAVGDGEDGGPNIVWPYKCGTSLACVHAHVHEIKAEGISTTSNIRMKYIHAGDQHSSFRSLD